MFSVDAEISSHDRTKLDSPFVYSIALDYSSTASSCTRPDIVIVAYIDFNGYTFA